MKPTYKINGIPLDDPDGRWYLENATTRRALPAPRSTAGTTPGRDGETYTPGDRLAAPTLGLTLIVTDRDFNGAPSGPAQTERNLEMITGIIYTREIVVEHFIGAQERSARARISSGTTPVALDNRLTRYRLAIALTIPDVFWAERTAGLTEAPLPNVSSTVAIPHLTGANAPISDAIIRIRGPFNGNVRIWNSIGADTGIFWTGEVITNAYLFINAATLRAWQSGVPNSWLSTGQPDGVDYPPRGPLELTPSPPLNAYRMTVQYPGIPPNDANAVGVYCARKFL